MSDQVDFERATCRKCGHVIERVVVARFATRDAAARTDAFDAVRPRR